VKIKGSPKENIKKRNLLRFFKIEFNYTLIYLILIMSLFIIPELLFWGFIYCLTIFLIYQWVSNLINDDRSPWENTQQKN
jgi:hypothetical protein